jgi:hypothetical protein
MSRRFQTYRRDRINANLHVEEVPNVLVVEGEDALENDHVGPVH